MISIRSLLLVLLFVLLPATTACVCPPWICGFDDEDRERFDDSDREDDRDVADNEDPAGDDEDADVAELDALSFAMSFEATAAAAGDDDDSAGDDDDSAEAREGHGAEIEGTLVTRYWSDWEGGELICEQHVLFDGSAFFEGAPDCGSCNGFLQLRASSIVDVSNPLLDDDHCDPGEAVDRGLNFGPRLLTPAGVGGLGDFLSIALVDAQTGLDLGLQFAPGDGLTYAEQADALSEDGMLLTHGGYLRSTPEGLVEGAGIDLAAGTPDADSDWFAFWRIFADPDANPHDGPELDGLYVAQSVWIVFPR